TGPADAPPTAMTKASTSSPDLRFMAGTYPPTRPGTSPKSGVAATKLVLAAGPRRAHTSAMSGYGQFCPIARASEIFAERWTPLIVREIMVGHHHFSEILKGLHSIS